MALVLIFSIDEHTCFRAVDKPNCRTYVHLYTHSHRIHILIGSALGLVPLTSSWESAAYDYLL